MSFGLAMSLEGLAKRLDKEGREHDAQLIRTAIHEMDLIDGRRASSQAPDYANSSRSKPDY